MNNSRWKNFLIPIMRRKTFLSSATLSERRAVWKLSHRDASEIFDAENLFCVANKKTQKARNEFFATATREKFRKTILNFLSQSYGFLIFICQVFISRINIHGGTRVHSRMVRPRARKLPELIYNVYARFNARALIESTRFNIVNT